jgi:hypothetical protein
MDDLVKQTSQTQGAQQSETKCIPKRSTNQATPKASAQHELWFDKLGKAPFLS